MKPLAALRGYNISFEIFHLYCYYEYTIKYKIELLHISNLFITLGDGSFNTLAEAKEAGAATLNYGLFINNVIDFLIVAFSIFIVIKQINRIPRKKEEPAPVQTKSCKYCFSEIHIDASKCPHCTSSLSE